MHNKLNYYLLCVAILAPGIVNLEDAEKAFYGRRDLTKKESVVTATGAILLKLRNKGLTYKDIGEIYGLKADAVYNRIRRYTGRIKGDDKNG